MMQLILLFQFYSNACVSHSCDKNHNGFILWLMGLRFCYTNLRFTTKAEV